MRKEVGVEGGLPREETQEVGGGEQSLCRGDNVVGKKKAGL